jgi:hypothetical protein
VLLAGEGGPGTLLLLLLTTALYPPLPLLPLLLPPLPVLNTAASLLPGLLLLLLTALVRGLLAPVIGAFAANRLGSIQPNIDGRLPCCLVAAPIAAAFLAAGERPASLLCALQQYSVCCQIVVKVNHLQ